MANTSLGVSAGSKSSFTVRIDTVNRDAYGALGTVRNTTDTVCVRSRRGGW